MKGEVRKYFNPRFYPFGSISEKVERADAKLWADKPGYQDETESMLRARDNAGNKASMPVEVH